MKTLFHFIIVLTIFSTSLAQQQNIETKSVVIENLISFMVDEYSISSDSIPKRNITFLIETYADRFNAEDGVMLKQAFKIMSNRLTEEDHVSIVTYSKLGGVVLNHCNAKNTKKLLYGVENYSSSINYVEDDGIEAAYRIAKENFTEETENSVVMVRIPNTSKTKSLQNKATKVTDDNSTNKSKNNNAVVLTAIALLPEIIKIIKD